MPGGVDRAIVGHQHDGIETLGAAQRVDGLVRGLRDRTCDIEGGVDRELDADVTAERLQIGVGEGIILGVHDLDSPGAVGMDDGRNFGARRGLDCAVSTM